MSYCFELFPFISATRGIEWRNYWDPNCIPANKIYPNAVFAPNANNRVPQRKCLLITASVKRKTSRDWECHHANFSLELNIFNLRGRRDCRCPIYSHSLPRVCVYSYLCIDFVYNLNREFASLVISTGDGGLVG